MIAAFDGGEEMVNELFKGAALRRQRDKEGGLMRGAHILTAAVFLLLAACSGPSTNEPAPPARINGEETPPVNGDDANLDVWLERLEVGSRELYSAREAVAAAVGLKEGDVIADIGAGTGLYTLLFAEEVGQAGHVYAVDIEPKFLELINRRAEDMGYPNITCVLGRDADITLPKNSLDVAFIADTYHYFTDREAIMHTVYDALKPGGSLIVVDYEIVPGQPRPPDKQHVRFGSAGVISEMEYVGFETVGAVAVEGLKENYFLRFRKP